MIQNKLVYHEDDIPHSPQLDTLHWHRIRTTLVSKRIVPKMSAHPLSVFEAMIKGVNRSLNWTENNPHPTVLFHAVDRKPNLRLWEGQMIPLEIMLTRATTREAYRWLEAFDAYLSDPATGRNFGELYLEEPEIRSLGRLVEETGFRKTEGRICLEFMTPLAFKHNRELGRTVITEEDFLSTLQRRMSRLFGTELHGGEAQGNIHLVTDYWEYSEIARPSGSQPGTTQYINGCVGPLVIEGSFGELVPYFLLGNELHAGKKIAFSQGHYRLHESVLDNLENYFLPQRELMPQETAAA